MSALVVAKLPFPSLNLVSADSVGFQLKSPLDYTVPRGERKTIYVDLRFHFPPKTYGRIAPRTELARNHGIDVCGGVIDPGFRGNVGVTLKNDSDTDFVIKRGDSIAQLICEAAPVPRLCQRFTCPQ